MQDGREGRASAAARESYPTNPVPEPMQDGRWTRKQQQGDVAPARQRLVPLEAESLPISPHTSPSLPISPHLSPSLPVVCTVPPSRPRTSVCSARRRVSLTPDHISPYLPISRRLVSLKPDHSLDKVVHLCKMDSWGAVSAAPLRVPGNASAPAASLLQLCVSQGSDRLVLLLLRRPPRRCFSRPSGSSLTFRTASSSRRTASATPPRGGGR